MRGDVGGGGANEVMGDITCEEEGRGLKNEDGFTRSVLHALETSASEFSTTGNFTVGDVTGAGAGAGSDSDTEVGGSETRAVEDWDSCT